MASCQLQDQALLRVDLHRLAWRDAEERRVEARNLVQHAGGEGVCLAALAAHGVQELVLVPALVRDLGNRVLPGV